MANKPSISRQLLEIALDAQAAARCVVEAGPPGDPALARLGAASTQVITALDQLDRVRATARHLDDHLDVSVHHRQRYGSPCALAPVDLPALRRDAEALRAAAIAVMQADRRLNRMRRELVAHADALLAAITAVEDRLPAAQARWLTTIAEWQAWQDGAPRGAA